MQYQKTYYMIANNIVMKALTKLVIIIAVLSLLHSCSTARLTISGTPGTKIMNSSGRIIATIDLTGKTTIKTNRDLGEIFLSQAPNDSLIVPFVPEYWETWSNDAMMLFCIVPIPGLGLAFIDMFESKWILPETQTNNDLVNSITVEEYRK